MRILVAVSISILLSAAQITAAAALEKPATSQGSPFAASLRFRLARGTPPSQPAPSPAPPVSSPTPDPTPPQPTPTPAPLPDFETATEQEVIRLMNVERVKYGVAAFSVDPLLTDLARAHSADMLANNYFSHTDNSGCSAQCRLQKAGYAYRSFGENLYMESGRALTPLEVATRIVSAWMQSAGHRQNILNAQYTVSGVGIASSGTRLYATSLYALPR